MVVHHHFMLVELNLLLEVNVILCGCIELATQVFRQHRGHDVHLFDQHSVDLEFFLKIVLDLECHFCTQIS